ncbi:MAG: trypsin-like peptidase domain-containing protein [Cyanobacteria bacterium SZAS LIN-2]|nr:trypsin-like peptidase domain-containing protein [Cyanobacteria bacterium SZAS LIN-2]MBS2010613.1 trypsin-like peptidase domain-containing protein [Cyanobacteria bacterium SZAS TMP-1]
MSPPRDIPVLQPNAQTVVETSASALDAITREVYQRNKDAVVSISVQAPNGKTFSGSGVLVKEGENVVIVTNAHLAANTRSIRFGNSAGERFAATLDKLGDTDDLAILKPDGIKINPANAVDIGDASKLSTGQMLYAMGHPRGYAKPTISSGEMLGVGSLDRLSPAMARLTRDAVSVLYGKDRAYQNAGEQFIQSSRIDTRVTSDHGSSGGGLFDEKGKLVGILHALPDEHVRDEILSISAQRVRQLLNDPSSKFDFGYRREALANQNPEAAMAKFVGLGALGVHPVSRMMTAPVVGTYYGCRALEDLRFLTEDNVYRDRSYYAEKLAVDGGTFAAGMLSFVPRFRLIGAAVVGARLAVDAITDFTETRPVLDKVERRGAETPEPLFWKLSHH